MKNAQFKFYAGNVAFNNVSVSNIKFAIKFQDFEKFIGACSHDRLRLMRKQVAALKAKLMREDDCVYADVAIVLAYIDKQLCLLGDGDMSLIKELNREQRRFLNLFPEIESSDLHEVVSCAAVEKVEIIEGV